MQMIWNENKECMSRDEMSALQGKRLHKIVNYVYHNVPFYRKKLQEMDITPDDIQTIEDISKLPFTTKQDLRDNYPFNMQAAPAEEIVRIHASSGTTGNPTIVGYTRKDIEVWSECMTRCLTAYGVTRKDIFSVAYGYGLFTGGLGAHYGVENLGASVVPTSTGNTEKHVRLIRDLGITGIACTPSYALYLAETMDKMDITRDQIKLRIGAFGAEPWTENMRKEIENRLGLKAFNLYGLSEIMGPCVSYECEKQNGSHINEDHFYPEIVDPNTLEKLPNGQLGELVFTTLTKEGMPLLRYRTKDLSSLMDGKCECGRTSVRMGRIMGRSDDMLIIRGINILPSQVESVILSMKEFAPRYLLVVDRINNLDTLLVQVELRQEYFTNDFDRLAPLEAIQKKLADKLKSVLSISAKVQLKAPGTIERSQGKSQFVVDKRKLN
jgi:phenylacetate-CoA ligase